MGEISIQQAALTGSIKSSENLTCEIVPEGGVSGKMVSPDIVHEVGVETPATRDKLGLRLMPLSKQMIQPFRLIKP